MFNMPYSDGGEGLGRNESYSEPKKKMRRPRSGQWTVRGDVENPTERELTGHSGREWGREGGCHK